MEFFASNAHSVPEIEKVKSAICWTFFFFLDNKRISSQSSILPSIYHFPFPSNHLFLFSSTFLPPPSTFLPLFPIIFCLSLHPSFPFPFSYFFFLFLVFFPSFQLCFAFLSRFPSPQTSIFPLLPSLTFPLPSFPSNHPGILFPYLLTLLPSSPPFLLSFPPSLPSKHHFFLLSPIHPSLLPFILLQSFFLPFISSLF